MALARHLASSSTITSPVGLGGSSMRCGSIKKYSKCFQSEYYLQPSGVKTFFSVQLYFPHVLFGTLPFCSFRPPTVLAVLAAHPGCRPGLNSAIRLRPRARQARCPSPGRPRGRCTRRPARHSSSAPPAGPRRPGSSSPACCWPGLGGKVVGHSTKISLT